MNSLSDSLIVELFQEQAYDTRVLIDKEDGHSKGWANHGVELLLQEQANKALVKRLVEQIFHAALLRYDIEMENELEVNMALCPAAYVQHCSHGVLATTRCSLAISCLTVTNTGQAQQPNIISSWLNMTVLPTPATPPFVVEINCSS